MTTSHLKKKINDVVFFDILEQDNLKIKEHLKMSDLVNKDDLNEYFEGAHYRNIKS